MPGSHPVANDKVLLKVSAVCSRSIVEVDYVQKAKLVHVWKSMIKILVRHLLHS